MRDFCWAICVVSLIGCGESSADRAESRRNAQDLFNDAVQAIEKQDHATAKPLLDKAIASGQLHVDIILSAHIKRAICSAVAGDFAAAHADLDKMEQGPVDLGAVWAARSFVLEKEGKSSEAKAAWSKARGYNPGVAKISG